MMVNNDLFCAHLDNYLRGLSDAGVISFDRIIISPHAIRVDFGGLDATTDAEELVEGTQRHAYNAGLTAGRTLKPKPKPNTTGG